MTFCRVVSVTWLTALAVGAHGCGNERSNVAQGGAGDGSFAQDGSVDGNSAQDGTGDGSGGVRNRSCPHIEQRPSRTRICDGSEDRTLSVRLGAGGRVGPGGLMLNENGSAFLHVQGDCRYWIGGYIARTGVLTEADADQLGRDLFYGEWQSRCLAGLWSQGGLFDGPTLTFSDGIDPVATYCVRECPIEGLPDEIRAMRNAWNTWRPRLAENAERVDGPVRILVLEGFQHFEDIIPVATWPLAWPLSNIAFDVDEDPEAIPPVQGDSLLIDAPSEVSALRTIWDEYLSGVHGDWFKAPPIPFRDNTPANDGGSEKLYRVFIRDTTPLEDERGLIPPITPRSEQ